MARMTAARITAAPPTLIPTIAPIERFDAEEDADVFATEEALLLLLESVVEEEEVAV